jgi:hypothetical protein
MSARCPDREQAGRMTSRRVWYRAYYSAKLSIKYRRTKIQKAMG